MEHGTSGLTYESGHASYNIADEAAKITNAGSSVLFPETTKHLHHPADVDGQVMTAEMTMAER